MGVFVDKVKNKLSSRNKVEGANVESAKIVVFNDLKRSNAKLQKQSKAPGKLSQGFKSTLTLNPSRVNSFEPGGSVEDFDVESREFARLRLEGPKNATAPSNPQSTVYAPSSAIGLSSSGRPAGSSYIPLVSKMGLRVIPPEPQHEMHLNRSSTGTSDSSATFPASSTTGSSYYSDVPSISDIDWNHVRDADLPHIAAAYGASNDSFIRYRDPGTPDTELSESSMDLPLMSNAEDAPTVAYIGKGKARALSGEFPALEVSLIDNT
jgi:hypothetical protein